VQHATPIREMVHASGLLLRAADRG
jgi:hypothetical protein